mmetsp:Transcript_37416/g.57033  ORF Transcript_37416/g.57033 Transcript_37416/m.57033 type:complete len:135 (+) Transcript_37416:2-406(+)
MRSIVTSSTSFNISLDKCIGKPTAANKNSVVLVVFIGSNKAFAVAAAEVAMKSFTKIDAPKSGDTANQAQTIFLIKNIYCNLNAYATMRSILEPVHKTRGCCSNFERSVNDAVVAAIDVARYARKRDVVNNDAQ